jgi:DNA-binding CsgD family transcriptional regulator
MSRIFTGLFLLVLDFMVYLVPFFATWLVGLRWRGPIAAVFGALAAAYLVLAMVFTVFLSGERAGLRPPGPDLPGDGGLRRRHPPGAQEAHRARAHEDPLPELRRAFGRFLPPHRGRRPPVLALRQPRNALPSGGIAFPAYFLWFSVIALVYLVGYFVHLPEGEKAGFSRDKLDGLKITAREREIIGLLARGLTSKEIGAELGISVHTVNNHLANIYAKAGAGNRIELLRALS